MNHDAAICDNLTKANGKLDAIKGNNPTQVVEAQMSIATVYMLGALVESVRELTEEIRKTREEPR